MSLFNAPTVLGSGWGGGQASTREHCLALVERLIEVAQETPSCCVLAKHGLGLHSFINTPSRRRDAARGVYANGAPEGCEQAPGPIVPPRWNGTASFAAILSTKRPRLTAPRHACALFAARGR
jgi:hypothetical protein